MTIRENGLSRKDDGGKGDIGAGGGVADVTPSGADVTPSGKGRDVTQETQETQDLQDTHRRTGKTTTNNGAAAAASPQIRFYRRLLAELEADEPVSGTFDEHAIAAYQGYLEVADNLDIWQSGVFHFMRMLKASPHVAHFKPSAALRKVESEMATWVPVSKATISKRSGAAWLEYFGADPEDARAEFLASWDKVRCIPGRGPLMTALEKSRESPIKFNSELSCDTDGYRAFLSLAGWLQVSIGFEDIYLPCHKIGELLGVKAMTISRYRKFAVEDGFLKPFREHDFKRRKASTFTFDIRRVPMLEEAAQRDMPEVCDTLFKGD